MICKQTEGFYSLVVMSDYYNLCGYNNTMAVLLRFNPLKWFIPKISMVYVDDQKTINIDQSYRGFGRILSLFSNVDMKSKVGFYSGIIIME